MTIWTFSNIYTTDLTGTMWKCSKCVLNKRKCKKVLFAISIMLSRKLLKLKILLIHIIRTMLLTRTVFNRIQHNGNVSGSYTVSRSQPTCSPDFTPSDSVPLTSPGIKQFCITYMQELYKNNFRKIWYCLFESLCRLGGDNIHFLW